MSFAPDYIAEQAPLDVSRAQREAANISLSTLDALKKSHVLHHCEELLKYDDNASFRALVETRIHMLRERGQ